LIARIRADAAPALVVRRWPRAQIYKDDWQGIIPLPVINDNDTNTPKLAHWSYLIICVFKLVGIAWAMAFKFRGGIIYPLIYAGTRGISSQPRVTYCGSHVALRMVPWHSVSRCRLWARVGRPVSAPVRVRDHHHPGHIGRVCGTAHAHSHASTVLARQTHAMCSLRPSYGGCTQSSATKTPIGMGIVMALAVTLTGQAKGFDMVILGVASGYSAVFTTAAIKFYDTQGPRNSQPACLVESAGDALPTVRPKEGEPADKPTSAAADDDDPSAAAGAMSPATMIEMSALSVDGAATTSASGPLDDPAQAATAPAQAAEDSV